MNMSDRLPIRYNPLNDYQNLYTAQEVKEGEKLLCDEQNVDLYDLMKKAGQALYTHLLAHYPQCKTILICCGKGNNGGDGYTLARLLKSNGTDVILWQIPSATDLKGDAAKARDEWLNLGGEIYPPSLENLSVDLIVDALLGIGIKGEVRETYSEVINYLNQHSAPILSVDLPSGLCADTGRVLGTAIHAEHTVSLVALKQGLFTGQARAYVGELFFAGLEIYSAFTQKYPTRVKLLTKGLTKTLMPKRSPTAHKGQCGKLLLIGGAHGMGGALILASEAAARSGVGLLSTLTHPMTSTALLSRRPEVMVHCVAEDLSFEEHQLFSAHPTIVIGPGLSTQKWGWSRWQELQRLHSANSVVLDADALNLLAEQGAWWLDKTLRKQGQQEFQPILTPHPGEAARLLTCSTAEIEHDRFSAVKSLAQKYQAVVVLKGAGTLISDGEQTWICPLGNAGMASGGMGDVLSGIIGSYVAQGLSPLSASLLGVYVHSLAADCAVNSYGCSALLASDLIEALPQVHRELTAQ